MIEITDLMRVLTEAPLPPVLKDDAHPAFRRRVAIVHARRTALLSALAGTAVRSSGRAARSQKKAVVEVRAAVAGQRPKRRQTLARETLRFARRMTFPARPQVDRSIEAEVPPIDVIDAADLALMRHLGIDPLAFLALSMVDADNTRDNARAMSRLTRGIDVDVPVPTGVGDRPTDADGPLHRATLTAYVDADTPLRRNDIHYTSVWRTSVRPRSTIHSFTDVPVGGGAVWYDHGLIVPDLPETIVAVLPLRRLTDVIRHPVLDRLPLTIESVDIAHSMPGYRLLATTIATTRVTRQVTVEAIAQAVLNDRLDALIDAELDALANDVAKATELALNTAEAARQHEEQVARANDQNVP